MDDPLKSQHAASTTRPGLRSASSACARFELHCGRLGSVSADDLAYSLPSCSSMRPARLCRATAAPIWFGRAPLHAVATSCCVLPVAKARTWSLRLRELRLPSAAFAAAVRWRPPDRAGAAAFVVVVLADAALPGRVRLMYRASTRSVAASAQIQSWWRQQGR